MYCQRTLLPVNDWIGAWREKTGGPKMKGKRFCLLSQSSISGEKKSGKFKISAHKKGIYSLFSDDLYVEKLTLPTPF